MTSPFQVHQCKMQREIYLQITLRSLKAVVGLGKEENIYLLGLERQSMCIPLDEFFTSPSVKRKRHLTSLLPFLLTETSSDIIPTSPTT